MQKSCKCQHFRIWFPSDIGYHCDTKHSTHFHHTMESSATTSTQHDYDHNNVQISTTGEQILKLPLAKENTIVKN